MSGSSQAEVYLLNGLLCNVLISDATPAKCCYWEIVDLGHKGSFLQLRPTSRVPGMWTKLPSYVSSSFPSSLRGIRFLPVFQTAWETSALGKAGHVLRMTAPSSPIFLWWCDPSTLATRRMVSASSLWLQLTLALVQSSRCPLSWFHCWPWHPCLGTSTTSWRGCCRSCSGATIHHVSKLMPETPQSPANQTVQVQLHRNGYTILRGSHSTQGRAGLHWGAFALKHWSWDRPSGAFLMSQGRAMTTDLPPHSPLFSQEIPRPQ